MEQAEEKDEDEFRGILQPADFCRALWSSVPREVSTDSLARCRAAYALLYNAYESVQESASKAYRENDKLQRENQKLRRERHASKNTMRTIDAATVQLRDAVDAAARQQTRPDETNECTAISLALESAIVSLQNEIGAIRQEAKQSRDEFAAQLLALTTRGAVSEDEEEMFEHARKRKPEGDDAGAASTRSDE